MLSQCVYIWYVSGEIQGCMVNLTFQCMLILSTFFCCCCLSVDLCKKHGGTNLNFQLLPIIIPKWFYVNTNGIDIYFMLMTKASLSIKQFLTNIFNINVYAEIITM